MKYNKTESPKTPGGISKSLLTPCRRVGLSRNWRKSGPSPFVSPITSSNNVTPDSIEPENKKNSRKRKVRKKEVIPKPPEEVVEENEPLSPMIDSFKNESIISTPCRNIDIPCKKSKLALDINCENDSLEQDTQSIQNKPSEKLVENSVITIENNEYVTPVARKSSKSKLKTSKTSKENKVENCNNSEPSEKQAKVVSPSDLAKKCVVVLQKKIFKNISPKNDQDNTKENIENNVGGKSSQTIIDSDSDDVPLSHIKENDQIITTAKNIYSRLDKNDSTQKNKAHSTHKPADEDNDFIETQSAMKIKKLVDKNTSTSSLLDNKKDNKPKKVVPKLLSQCSNSSDDDDFDFNNKKRTIVIRKTYDKIKKPVKAKSTGSITQKDIDDLKARIETKKKMLLAQAMADDTQDLRDLIKKWQKGCQDALINLMDLMKSKCSNNSNMDYLEILKNLKIPPTLVGYDAENDCFTTPSDENIILSKFNDC